MEYPVYLDQKTSSALEFEALSDSAAIYLAKDYCEDPGDIP